jgi:asparagine synthase (glutamine-hydrolysing)
MCGIVSNFRPGGQATSLMLAALEHRGPDFAGEWWSPERECWLGHTRLAILDLSSKGAQPMHDSVNGNVIVFNGEIYNHRELRQQLASCHPSWQGSSDTETLLIAYRRWKSGMLSRLKGMFALVIYDAETKSLFVARDRLGIKPLYYTWRDGALGIASEVRVLLNGTRPVPTHHAVSAFLQFGACPETDLIFPEVKSFPAGHWMSVSAEGAPRLKRFWPPPRFNCQPVDDPAQRVRELLERAVEEHLLADVPVAGFLSGGIDSSIITALAARTTTNRLQTFTVGFPCAAFDETDVAEAVAKRCGTEHHRIEVSDEESCHLVREAVEKMDLPSVDAINTYIVARKVAAQGIKVALSGLGGDELFGGYPSFTDVPKLKWLARLPGPLRRQLSWFGALGRRLADLPSDGVAALTLWRRRFWTEHMLRKAELPLAFAQHEEVPDLPDDFARVSWVELSGYMRHLLLRDSDQMSMAVSLELRVPFLDHELVEFVLGLSARAKKPTLLTKALLVEACRDLLPEAVYKRSKMGFALPMADWMRGPLASFVTDAMREIIERDYLSGTFADRLVADFKSGRLHWTRLWSVVVLGHYLRRLDGIELPLNNEPIPNSSKGGEPELVFVPGVPLVGGVKGE